MVNWADFFTTIPLEKIRIITVADKFRNYLLTKYKSLESINKNYSTEYQNISEISEPYLQADWTELMLKKNRARFEFVGRNYVEVIRYILLHGRAFFVTLVYISLVILTTLTVNPLCAYALSRFKISYSYKILLFLLVTMAFPAEVSMIPNFLLLKNLNMLNTMWALVLPGMANGFFIFLLKGFFDSLPKELYEAAMLDGASEITIYRRITFQLAKPVLAFMTLGAFQAAYGAFFFAMIVCQNSEMWTLMVWIYQMQNWAPEYMITAALTLTAIPSLIVFAFCQNIIMRGIILPVAH